VGGVSEPPLSDQGRKFLLASLTQTYRDELAIFRDVVHHPGFLDKLNRVIVELMESGSGLGSEPSWLTHNINPDDGIVDAKAHDLALLLQAYQRELNRRGLTDDSWGWAEASAGIVQTDFLHDAQVWIDGFQGFAPYELALIASLLQKANQVTITLRLDPAIFSNIDLESESQARDGAIKEAIACASSYVFAHSATALQTLIDLAWDLAVPYTIDTLPVRTQILGTQIQGSSGLRGEAIAAQVELYRFSNSEELAYLEDQLCNPPLNPIPLEGAIESIAIVPRANYRDEAMVVARFLVGQAREHGVRWKDMAVAASDLALYGELLADVFDSWGIPFFLDEPQSVRWHPLMVFSVGLLEIVSTKWSTKAVMQVLKSDLIGGGRAWVDTLENYALVKGIDGQLWLEDRVWDQMLDDLGLESPEMGIQIDALRRIRAFYENVAHSLQEPMLGRHLMLRLWTLLEDLGIPERLDYWMGEGAVAGGGARDCNPVTTSESRDHGVLGRDPAVDHVGVWNLWVDLVDDFIQGLGDVALTWHEFAGLIEDSLASLALTRIPLGLDQVIVTAPARLINSEVRVLVVVGADEKHLRFGGGEDIIVNDGERAILQRRNWPLETQGRIQTQKEPEFWYSLFTRATDSLCITYSLADPEGKAQEPAPVIRELYRLLPQLDEARADTDGEINSALSLSPLSYPCTISDAADATASALGLWREGLGGSQSFDPDLADEVMAMYNWLIGLDQGRRALARRLAGLSYTNGVPPLGRSTIHRVFGKDLHTNVHHLEAMARCPFGHFASGILRLKERDLLTWDARLEGILWHEALARFIRHLQATGQDLGMLEETKLETMADAIWQETISELVDDFAKGLKSYEYRVGRLQRAFRRVIGVLAEHARRGHFRPIAAEVAFGYAGESAWHIDLSDGRGVYLRGRIDCIEAATAGDVLYVRVLDFKSGTQKINLPDVYYGLSLQLLAYLGFLENSAPSLLAMATGAGGVPAESVVLAGALYLPIHEPFVSLDGPLEPEALARKLLAKYKMQGVILDDLQVIELMENDLSGWSNLLPLGRKKDGTLYKGSSAYAEGDMEILTAYVKQRIGELGEQILLGNIDIAPFRTANARACTYCPYPALCRFELGVPGCGYRYISTMAGADALALMGQAVEEKRSAEKAVGGARRG
ncbi:MAG: hypothetical protein GX986_05140, partial [Firmicutes bacterium]|nr:hypothetical protein [Bacillota bacterium]